MNINLRGIGFLIFLIVTLVILGCGSDTATQNMQAGEPQNASQSNSESQAADIPSKKDLKAREKPNYVQGEILVKFKPHAAAYTDSDVQRKVKYRGVSSEVKRTFKFINVHHLKITDPNITVEDAIKKLKDDPDIEYVQPNYIYKADSVPNDTSFGSLWGMNNTGQTGGTPDADIDAPEAWDTETGDPSIVLAVIDTGIDYTHEDLATNMWTNPGETANNLADDDGNGYVDDVYGINAINTSGEPLDDHGHGTHVAGTIGAVGNNNKGVAGVNHTVKIMALKFIDAITGEGLTSDAVECINYVVTMKARGVNIKATNNSWGGGSYDAALYDAIYALKTNDILFVASAGNDSANNDSITRYPSGYNLANIVAVAASDHNDSLAWYSNYGATTVDLSAPGSSIYSSLNGGTVGSYTPASGDTFYDNMESGSGNWTSQSPWAITTEQNHTSGGSNAWSDSPYGNYADYLNISITSNAININGVAGDLRLGFWVRGSLEDPYYPYDYLFVEVSGDNGSTWRPIGFLTGDMLSSAWQLKSYYIPLAYRTTTFKFRFRLKTDYSNPIPYDGVYIDDVGIGVGTGSNNYDSFSGTSMAAPHVAGVAGLVLAANSALTYQQVKDVILNNVDKKTALLSSSYSGGRLNAYNAVYAASNYSSLPTAPSGLTASSVSTSQINLSWTDSSNETGYKIERRISGVAYYTEITTTAAGITAYSDTGLSASTPYYYRVRANNSFGNSSYSTEASATTQSPPSSGGGGGGGCFIATAAYGSYLAPEVQALREFRDKYLTANPAGRAFVEFYYKASPPVAEYISKDESLRAVARLALTPVVYGVKYPFVALGFAGLVCVFVFYKRRLGIKNLK